MDYLPTSPVMIAKLRLARVLQCCISCVAGATTTTAVRLTARDLSTKIRWLIHLRRYKVLR